MAEWKWFLGLFSGWLNRKEHIDEVLAASKESRETIVAAAGISATNAGISMEMFQTLKQDMTDLKAEMRQLKRDHAAEIKTLRAEHAKEIEAMRLERRTCQEENADLRKRVEELERSR